MRIYDEPIQLLSNTQFDATLSLICFVQLKSSILNAPDFLFCQNDC